jgi:hypothetical protein
MINSGESRSEDRWGRRGILNRLPWPARGLSRIRKGQPRPKERPRNFVYLFQALRSRREPQFASAPGSGTSGSLFLWYCRNSMSDRNLSPTTPAAPRAEKRWRSKNELSRNETRYQGNACSYSTRWLFPLRRVCSSSCNSRAKRIPARRLRPPTRSKR